MKYETQNIRNIAVMGHSGVGKTSLCEAILFNAKATDRMGKILDGNTVMDFDEQEIARKNSISLAVASCEYKDVKINLLDVPGIFDFEGEGVEALAAADAAIIVEAAGGSVSVGTEKTIESCQNIKKPMMIFVNQVDKDNAAVIPTIDALQEAYGNAVVVVALPIIDANHKMQGYVNVIEKKAYIFGAGAPTETDIPADLSAELDKCYNILVEAAAENDDELLEKYFGGEELTIDEIKLGLKKGIISGSTIPVLCGSATSNSGIINLMGEIISVLPSPLDNTGDYCVDGDNKTPYKVAVDGPCQVRVFKTIADPFVGKMNLIKVMGGTLRSGMTLNNMTSEKQEKIPTLLLPKGKKQGQTDTLCAGDIGALSKLSYTNTGDTLSEDGKVKFAPLAFPTPMIEMAVGAVKSNEDEKVIQGLYRLLEEDSTFSLKKNTETAEMLICGMGETHLDVICKKLKSKFNVEAKLADPKIPYRETIRKTVEAEGKHKKQSGGHGQYGHCKMRFEPCEEDFVFDSEVVGGTVPKQYIPAIEKGLRECLPKGVLAGYPVVGLKAVVYDGSYHDVDSSEMAFKIAASLAYKEGLKNARPVILEPIMSVEITVPESYTGDIMGDMNKRRGRILGMDMVNKKQVIHAEAPQSEMFKYATDLRSMTQGRGKFTMNFERYEEAPQNIIDKIVKERAALLAADND